jgi:drug/metabolite transporter (DMT)-like permease
LEVTKNRQHWATLSLLLVNLIYGASHVLAKGVMPTYLSPTVFIVLRILGATFLFWLLAFVSRPQKIKTKDLFTFLACGFFGITVNQLLFFHGLNLSSPMNAGIIMALNPIMVAILSFFLIREALSLRQWVGIGIGAFGAIALTAFGSSYQFSVEKGDLFLLGNSLSYAFYLILVKPLMKKYDPITVITWVFTFGSVFILLFPPVWEVLPATSFQGIPPSVWYKIIFVIVGVTFLTYLLTVVGLKYVSATIASVFIYFQPIFVMVFTFVFFTLGWSEDYSASIHVRKILLMAIVMVGVFLTSKPMSKRK